MGAAPELQQADVGDQGGAFLVETAPGLGQAERPGGITWGEEADRSLRPWQGVALNASLKSFESVLLVERSTSMVHPEGTLERNLVRAPGFIQEETKAQVRTADKWPTLESPVGDRV